jgi:hypothetical protein
MMSIQTKYLGATNNRGSRITAFHDGRRVTVPYDSSKKTQGAHFVAVEAFIEKHMKREYLSSPVRLLAGDTSTGYVFTFVSEADMYTIE